MSNHRISVDSPDGTSYPLDFGGGTLIANEAESVMNIADYLQAIASGIKLGKIRFNYGAVQASGTVTFSSFADADTITVNGVLLTGKTTPSGANQWAVGASDEACANNLYTKINASALNKIVGVVGATRRATVALASFVTTNTVTINSVVFTGKTTPDAGTPEQFGIGTTDTITAQNLVNAINRSQFPGIAGIVASASAGTVTLNYNGVLTVANSANATVTSTIVVLTSIVAGQIGNLCTLAISAHGSVSAANMSGGTEGTEVILAKNYSAI